MVFVWLCYMHRHGHNDGEVRKLLIVIPSYEIWSALGHLSLPLQPPHPTYQRFYTDVMMCKIYVRLRVDRREYLWPRHKSDQMHSFLCFDFHSETVFLYKLAQYQLLPQTLTSATSISLRDPS